MDIYLDNAATTKPLDSVIDRVASVMKDTYGNPSSLHKKGIEAEKILKQAKETFSKHLGASKEEIYFTSGGTESNNTAIMGAAYAYQRNGKKIITSAVEHASVKEVFSYLESNGFEVVVIPVNKEGYIDEEKLFDQIDEQTILVSIMHVNNEIGTVQDIERIGYNIKVRNNKTIFHVDGVQSFGKIPIHVKKAKIDLLSLSGHKFYGPKGIGVLYKNKDILMRSLIYGGGQQKNIRSGTENVPGVAGMTEACDYVFAHFEEITIHYKGCKEYFCKRLFEEIKDLHINGPKITEGAPHIINIGFKDIKAEVLLHALEHNNIYVSSGSACSSNKKYELGVLEAIGNKGSDRDNAIRFSFGIDTTKEDLDHVINVLKEQVALLRKFKVGGRK